MNKQEFIKFLKENINTNIEYELICNIVDYAQGMDKEEQFDFLWGMLQPLNVDENVLKNIEF